MAEEFYLPGAEPFFFKGDDTGCLLVHGFMSSPGEMRWLGRYLHEQGNTVYGPRLTGHGTDYQHMMHLRWPEWYGSVMDAYTLLRQFCSRVYVIGHSMGGLLTLMTAATAPVDGVVIMASPLVFNSRLIRYSWLWKYFMRYHDATDHTHLPQYMRDEQKRLGEPVLGRIRYDLWSTAALAQLYALSQAVQERLPQITQPACLIYSNADKTAPYNNMQLLAGQIRSRVIIRHTLHKSDHNLMVDEEKDMVFELIWHFIQSQKA